MMPTHLKETKSYLKHRWTGELKSIGDLLTSELKRKGDLSKLDLPKTTDGLIDLRGFSAPKKFTTVKSNSGRPKTYVSEGVRVKKITFEGVDFSFSDFERCEFFNCIFNHSKFKEARFVASEFWGCEFLDMDFTKTNFGHSTFQTSGLIFKKIKDNFTNVSFDQVNFSEALILDQSFQDCRFSHCKTGALRLSRCVLSNLYLTGLIRNLFIIKSRKIDGVDFTKSIVSGLNLEEQDLGGFSFPEGEAYFKFQNKSEELANLRFLDHLTDKEKKLVDVLKFVWSRNNLEEDFVDVNWLKEDEIETGKLIIKELKKVKTN